MEHLNQPTIFFSLNEEDIQTVALEEIERNLTVTEIESLKDLIASQINWYDAIANVIHSHFSSKKDIGTK